MSLVYTFLKIYHLTLKVPVLRKDENSGVIQDTSILGYLYFKPRLPLTCLKSCSVAQVWLGFGFQLYRKEIQLLTRERTISIILLHQTFCVLWTYTCFSARHSFVNREHLIQPFCCCCCWFATTEHWLVISSYLTSCLSPEAKLRFLQHVQSTVEQRGTSPLSCLACHQGWGTVICFPLVSQTEIRVPKYLLCLSIPWHFFSELCNSEVNTQSFFMPATAADVCKALCIVIALNSQSEVTVVDCGTVQ